MCKHFPNSRSWKIEGTSTEISTTGRNTLQDCNWLSEHSAMVGIGPMVAGELTNFYRSKEQFWIKLACVLETNEDVISKSAASWAWVMRLNDEKKKLMKADNVIYKFNNAQKLPKVNSIWSYLSIYNIPVSTFWIEHILSQQCIHVST